MDVNKQFFFSDFELSRYIEFLSCAKCRYDFVSFKDALSMDSFLINRHDIDFSVQRALRLAQEEHSLGLKSTYFLHLHSEYYNLLDKEISRLVRSIVELGHHIGVHFDTHYYDIEDESNLEDALDWERRIIERMFSVNCDVFSFHNTTSFTMGCKKLSYAGLLNTYATEFQDGVKYCSDSNGYWRYDRLFDLIDPETYPKLHVLTHPVWWQDTIMSPWEKIQRSINKRAQNNLQMYRQLLRQNKMKNIDWVGEI